MMQQPQMPQMHAKSAGGGSSIIGLLQVVESNTATELAKVELQEEDEQANYETLTQENKVSMASKQQDVKYKSKAVTMLEKTLSELTSDKDDMSSVQSAVLQYFAKLKDRCVAKPEAYEEWKTRREAEIAGLKEA